MVSGLDGSAVVSSDAGISALGSADVVGSLAGFGSAFAAGSAVTLLSTSICLDDGSALDGSPFRKNEQSIGV